jgi:hypothetical protein
LKKKVLKASFLVLVSHESIHEHFTGRSPVIGTFEFGAVVRAALNGSAGSNANLQTGGLGFETLMQVFYSLEYDRLTDEIA